jgi:copper chaperone CopZ
MKQELIVKGMHCKSCVMLVTDVLQDLGAKDISIDLNEKKQVAKITLEYAGKKEDIVKAIAAEGYTVA